MYPSAQHQGPTTGPTWELFFFVAGPANTQLRNSRKSRSMLLG